MVWGPGMVWVFYRFGELGAFARIRTGISVRCSYTLM